MERIKLRGKNSLSAFTNIYVPFGILIFIAIMAAELTQNLTYYRTIYSIWVTTALLIPAIFLYILPGESEKKTDYGLLLWTFSFFEQGVAIATANLILTLWWGIDVFLGWFSDSSTKWIQIQSLGAHIYIVLTFFF
jgi:hypothetical protein